MSDAKFTILFIGGLLGLIVLLSPTEEEREERRKIRESRELQESFERNNKKLIEDEQEKINEEMRLSLFNYVKPIIKSFV